MADWIEARLLEFWRFCLSFEGVLINFWVFTWVLNYFLQIMIILWSFVAIRKILVVTWFSKFARTLSYWVLRFLSPWVFQNVQIRSMFYAPLCHEKKGKIKRFFFLAVVIFCSTLYFTNEPIIRLYTEGWLVVTLHKKMTHHGLWGFPSNFLWIQTELWKSDAYLVHWGWKMELSRPTNDL